MKYSIPKGTKDVLPAQSYKWQFVESCARETARVYNLKEIRTPTFEMTELFSRGVGETTDVVNKEMYTFLDKGGRSITLKPEGTAGAARLFIENGLASTPMPVKTFYLTSAFRYERPQSGRLREFHQFGIEVFGSSEPETDAEVIFAAGSFLDRLGIEKVKLQLNSIGCKNCRSEYNKELKKYYLPHLDKVCETCKTRYEKNPLRLLDCKEEGCSLLAKNAPKIIDYLCPDCKAHFERVKSLLETQGVEFSVNPYIVRGLDYYSRTVFEFVSDSIGSQGTVCGGGRYDGLIEELGGTPTPAIGFAAGLERLILLMENTEVKFPDESRPTIYLAGMDDESRAKAFEIAVSLRARGISAECDLMKRSVKAQFKYADKIGAKYVGVIGSDELQKQEINLKEMSTGETKAVSFDEIYTYLK